LLCNVIKDIFKQGDINPVITFKQNYEQTGNELYIPATNVNRKKVYFFSHYTHPRMSIVQAVAMSMCVPLVWSPFNMNGDTWVDAGLGENYPIYIFNDLQKLREGRVYEISRFPINPKTLGVKLLTRGETNDRQLYHGRQDVPSLFGLLLGVIDTVEIQMELGDVSPSYINQTLSIPNFNTSMFELQRSHQDVVELGRKCTIEYFQNENKDEDVKEK
jgi:predicted acylesterase/phospholipase RssA